jgi:hypothetical protein
MNDIRVNKSIIYPSDLVPTKPTPARWLTALEQNSPNDLIVAVGGDIGAFIGSAKGNTKAGFWWGFLLGPIGWIIMAVKKS